MFEANITGTHGHDIVSNLDLFVAVFTDDRHVRGKNSSGTQQCCHQFRLRR